MFKLVMAITNWFSIDRAIGLSLLFSSVIMAFEPLRAESLISYMINETGLSHIIVSHWYMLSGMYLIHKGRNVKLGPFLLCVTPTIIVLVSTIYISLTSQSTDVAINGSDIAREFTVGMIIIQRILALSALWVVEVFESAMLETVTGK